MFLLDSMVPSELRKGSRADPRVWAWNTATPLVDQFLSVISLVEFRSGAYRKEGIDPQQARSLHRWIDGRIIPAFAGRILPVTVEVAERCARLHTPTERAQRDMLIAATALAHDLTVVTRNLRHFQPAGVRILNPWD